MNKQWLGTVVFGACVVCAPILANALWRRGVSRPTGYVMGFALMLIGVVVVKLAGGFPHALE
jgi:hypothetical protein